MRYKIVLVLFLLTIMTIPPTITRSEEYKIYPTDKPLISKYTVRRRADGSYAVYPTGRPVLPKYIIRQNSTGNGYNIYKPGQPLIPIYDVKGFGDLKER